MSKTNNSKKTVIDAYLEFLSLSRFSPSISDLKGFGITPKMVEYNFVNSTKLHNYMKKNHPEAFEHILDESVFTKKRFTELKKSIKGTSRFIITTAVVEQEVDMKFYNTIKGYCAHNDAELLVLPSAAVTKSRRENDWNLDPILKDDHIVYSDLKLNSNLFISSINVSAKQVNPLTGLARIGQRHGSLVYASPKQFLEYVATSNSKKLPHALMTTGALTRAVYDTDSPMSKRTDYISENDHVMGAIVVELESNGNFHFRQIQSGADGSFVDLGIRYFSDSSTKLERPEAIVLGDWHSGSTDNSVVEALYELVEDVRPKNLILHDAFDGKSISHHHEGKPLVQAGKARSKSNSLSKELDVLASDLKDLLTWVDDSVIIVKSNHDEHLKRYLVEGRYVKDPQNHYDALGLAKMVLDGKDPLKESINGRLNKKESKRLYWLKRDSEYKVGGVECGAHGDLGANGSRGSLRGMEKAYGNSITGHSHTAGILRGAWAVGTTSNLKLDYSKGPSSWTHTACLVYKDGSRQLINVIKGKWHKE